LPSRSPFSPYSALFRSPSLHSAGRRERRADTAPGRRSVKHAVVAEPGDRSTTLEELWQIRDLLAESDPDAAAQLHAIYNRLCAEDRKSTRLNSSHVKNS